MDDYSYLIYVHLIYNTKQKKGRTRNTDITKRKNLCIEHNKKLFNTVIKDLANEERKSFHTLIELSTNQWKRHCDNSIIVAGIIEQQKFKGNTHVKYSNVEVGKNLHLKKN